MATIDTSNRYASPETAEFERATGDIIGSSLSASQLLNNYDGAWDHTMREFQVLRDSDTFLGGVFNEHIVEAACSAIAFTAVMFTEMAVAPLLLAGVTFFASSMATYAVMSLAGIHFHAQKLADESTEIDAHKDDFKRIVEKMSRTTSDARVFKLSGALMASSAGLTAAFVRKFGAETAQEKLKTFATTVMTRYGLPCGF